MRRLVPQLCAAFLAVVFARPAQAFECKLSESYSYVSLSWSTRSIAYGIREPGATKISSALATRAVHDAFEQWTTPDCTDVSFVDRGEVTAETSGVNQVVFQPDEWKYARDAVALTRTTYGTEDGIIRSATIEVNEAIFDFLDASAGCMTQMPAYDITAVLTHEVGHLLGLDHTRQFSHSPDDPTMAPEVGPCEMDKRSIEADDVEGLCLLYPVGEPPGRCERIPAQADPYVANQPFGCMASSRGDASLLFLALVFFALRTRSRKRMRSQACPQARDG